MQSREEASRIAYAEDVEGIHSVDLEGHAITQASVAQASLVDDFGESDFEEDETSLGVEVAVNNEQIIGEEAGSFIGKIFPTLEDAYGWYNNYAMSKGFGTRIGFNRRSKKNNEILKKRFMCNKNGFKNCKDVDEGRNIRRRRDTRTGCEAQMEVKLTELKSWTISKFNDIHNHQLTTPSKVLKHRSHSAFHRSRACKVLVNDLSSSGVRPCFISLTVNALTATQEATVTPRQCSHIIRKQRESNIDRECYGIIKHFQEKAAADDAFFFTVDLDEDGFLRSVFWADGRSRASYTQFGDVIVFDVTNKTNKFKMPFAPFVGVNHHRQSILYGGALLMDEMESTFTWVFEQFLKCMYNIEPPAIITDQDKAMGNAIRKVFPNAKHRFCAWHVNKHAIEHLASFRAKYSDFNLKYKELLKCQSSEQFELMWESFSEEFNVEKNIWLDRMYDLRAHWVKAYLKDHFFAGMTTSGRSESIHSFFDGYLNSNTMLNEFIVQYDIAVNARREAENDEDFRTMNTNAVLSFGHPIEEQAGKCYTRAIFNILQMEWKKSVQLFHEKIDKEKNIVRYKVGIPIVEQSRWRVVTYEPCIDTLKIKCSCGKFETDGILCKHILYILRKKCVKQIPKQYILNRWCIDARFKVHGIGSLAQGLENSHFTTWSICARFNKVLEDARNNPRLLKKIGMFIDDVLLEAAKLIEPIKMKVT